MRWLFVGVVVLNITYFAWAFASGKERPVAVVPADTASAGSFPAQLQLLASVAEPTSPVTSSVPAPRLAGCPAIGPIADGDVANDLAERLGKGGIESEVQLAEKESFLVYWVYLPPLDGRQQALRKLRELHAAGIDSFILIEGPDANAVSLGSFSVRDSALGLQERLRSSGYPAQVREQLKAGSKYWVVVADGAAQGFLEFVPRELQATVRLERRSCP